MNAATKMSRRDITNTWESCVLLQELPRCLGETQRG